MNYRSCWSCLDPLSHARNNLKKIIWRKDLLEVRFCFERLNSSLTFIYRFLMSWRQNLLHGGVGARTFIYHSLSDSSLLCRDPLQLHSVTLPRPDWMLHIVYSGIILYGPQNNSPLSPSEETFCSQCTNARSLFIGLLFLEGGGPTKEPRTRR